MRGKPFRFDDLGGGGNFRDSDYLLENNQARDLLNVISRRRGDRGVLRSRDGSVLFHTGNPVLGIAPCEATASRRLIRNTATELIALDTAGAVVTTQALAAGRFEWISAPPNGGQGPLYGMDGTNARYFDGAALGTWTASAGTLPIGKYLAQWELRTLIAGRASTPYSVHASDVGNPRAHDTTGDAWEVQLDPSDGQPISGIGLVGPYAIAFKPSKLYILNDPDTGANRRLGENVGCPAHRSIVESPYGLFFLSEDGVYLTDGNRLDPISEAVDPLLDDIVPSMRSQAAGSFINDRYRLSICTSGSANNRTLEYDPRRKAWWVHDLAAPQWANWRRADEPELIGARGDDIYRAFVPGVTDDLGVAIPAFWKSGWHSFGASHLRKRCRQIHFDGSGKFDFYIGKDFANANTRWAGVDFTSLSDVFGGVGTFGVTGTFGGEGAVKEASVYTLGIARAWSVMFSSVDPFEVDSYTMAMTGRKD